MPFPLGNLQLETLNGPHADMTEAEAKEWRKFKLVLRDFRWESEDGNMGITLKKGRFIDGASVPPFLWPLVGSPFGPLVKAGGPHDEYYRDGSNRGLADMTMKAILKECPDVNKFREIVVTAGLMLFGWWTWRKYRGQFPFHKRGERK